MTLNYQVVVVAAALPDWPRPAARVRRERSGCWFWNGTRNRAAF